MDKSMIKGIVVGGVAVTALAAGGIGYQAITKPVFAEVVATREATETVKTPREECEDVVVQHQAPVKDEHRVTGTVVTYANRTWSPNNQVPPTLAAVSPRYAASRASGGR